MKKSFFINLLIIMIIVSFADSAYCAISDDHIKAASTQFVKSMKDWMPAIIGGGLMGSGICLFANNFKMGVAGLAGTAFLYAAREFTNNGEAALIDTAAQLLSMIS